MKEDIYECPACRRRAVHPATEAAQRLMCSCRIASGASPADARMLRIAVRDTESAARKATDCATCGHPPGEHDMLGSRKCERYGAAEATAENPLGRCGCTAYSHGRLCARCGHWDSDHNEKGCVSESATSLHLGGDCACPLFSHLKPLSEQEKFLRDTMDPDPLRQRRIAGYKAIGSGDKLNDTGAMRIVATPPPRHDWLREYIDETERSLEATPYKLIRYQPMDHPMHPIYQPCEKCDALRGPRTESVAVDELKRPDRCAVCGVVVDEDASCLWAGGADCVAAEGLYFCDRDYQRVLERIREMDAPARGHTNKRRG